MKAIIPNVKAIIQGSVITPDLQALATSAPGVGQTGRIGQGTFTARPGTAAQTYDTTISATTWDPTAQQAITV